MIFILLLYFIYPILCAKYGKDEMGGKRGAIIGAIFGIIAELIILLPSISKCFK